MRRFALIATIAGALFVSAAQAQARVVYRRPITPARTAVRATARVAAPPYRRVYAGPRYGYRGYGRGIGVGVGVY